MKKLVLVVLALLVASAGVAKTHHFKKCNVGVQMKSDKCVWVRASRVNNVGAYNYVNGWVIKFLGGENPGLTILYDTDDCEVMNLFQIDPDLKGAWKMELERCGCGENKSASKSISDIH